MFHLLLDQSNDFVDTRVEQSTHFVPNRPVSNVLLLPLQDVILVYCYFTFFHSTLDVQPIQWWGQFKPDVVAVGREASLFHFEPLNQLPHRTGLYAVWLDALTLVGGVQFGVVSRTEGGVS